MEPSRKRSKWSPVWRHFTASADGKSAQCSLCDPPTTLKISNGSTTGLKRHYESFHASKPPTDNTDEPKPFNFEESVCKMACVDGLSFHAIVNSGEIRGICDLAGYRMPQSENTIRTMVLKLYNEKSREVTHQIKSKLEEGKKFSVCLDEWTSTANKKYMNVTLRTSRGAFYNLGLARMQGSATAEVCLGVLEAKLVEFEVSLKKDVVAIITDGASVMKKMGRISGKPHQLCIAHGLHLAITKSIYCSPAPSTAAQEMNEEADFLDTAEQEDEDLTSGVSIVETEEELQFNAKAVIQKVREVVKIFKNSTVRNDALQNYVRNSNNGRELALILDVKTRWNTLVDMVERFLQLIDEVKLALLDLHQNITFSEEELELLHHVVAILKPVKLAAESICSRDMTLRKCDLALKFLLDKLSEVKSELSAEFQEAVKTQIHERRNELAQTMEYLHTGERQARTGASKSSLISTIKKITETCRIDHSENISFSSGSIFENSESENLVEISLESQLHDLFQADDKRGKNNVVPSDSTFEGILKREMALFENGGSRGASLELAYQLVSVIPPTSVESERVFSSANNFCTKLKTKLKDDTLNALVFLKSFYLHLNCEIVEG